MKLPETWEEFEETLEDDELRKLIGYYYQSPEDQRKGYAQQYPALQAWVEEGWAKQYPEYKPPTEKERQEVSESWRKYIGSLYDRYYYERLQEAWTSPYIPWGW